MLFMHYSSQLDLFESSEKYPDKFQLICEVNVLEEQSANKNALPWSEVKTKGLSPIILFSSADEFNRTCKVFSKCLISVIKKQSF